MHQKTTRSRLGKLAIGALVGSVLSIGAVSGASAEKPAELDGEATTTISVAKWDRWGGGATSMRSGIRW